MADPRLSLALAEAAPSWPAEGRIAVFAPRAEVDLAPLEPGRLQLIQPLKPDHDRLAARGFEVTIAPEGEFAAALVMLPRAKALARDLVAQAEAAAPGGLLLIDGQKTDGIESLVRDMRKRAPVEGLVSKAHGKAAWLRAGPAEAPLFADWRSPGPREIAPGFVTQPGIFSADGIDPASALLAEALPAKLSGRVADLGAGWGYLAARVLDFDAVEELHLVEADHAALACARRNVADPRAQFHWADATAWKAPAPLDAVVMNPPFHNTRKADPDLGRAFIASAAANLAPSGRLYMVANRHLPYEAELDARFAKVEALGGDTRFKLFMAQRPLRRQGGFH